MQTARTGPSQRANARPIGRRETINTAQQVTALRLDIPDDVRRVIDELDQFRFSQVPPHGRAPPRERRYADEASRSFGVGRSTGQLHQVLPCPLISEIDSQCHGLSRSNHSLNGLGLEVGQEDQ
jgi:hypothetical protein